MTTPRAISCLLLVGGLAVPATGWADAPPAEGPAAPPDLTGTWRFDMQIVSHAQIPVLGVAEIHSRTVYLARVTGPPAAPTVHAKACRMTAWSTKAIATTRIPQAFVDAVPERRVPARFSPAVDGWSFHLDLTPNHLGYDPARSPGGVPRELDHPAVVDFEGDGHPGGTILLDAPLFGEVQIYVVQHAHTVLDGTWTGADTWGGRATVRGFEQRSIGASNRLFAANADVTVDSEQSRFRWTRVEAGTGCAALRKGLAEPPSGWH